MFDISISIVSHRQFGLVRQLLQDIESHCAGSSLEVILTLNVPESAPIATSGFTFPLRVISNDHSQGFGENHNAAFRQAEGRYFCVMNPDIRLPTDPFPQLVAQLSTPDAGVVAPQIVNIAGLPEDNARALPTPGEIVGKLLGGKSAVRRPKERDTTDWLAGMFLVFPREVYAKIGGFDERYFLYYEDVDICLRLRLAGYQVRLCGVVTAIHEARRSSRHNPKYMYWHFSSMMRFFLSRPYRKMRRDRRG